MKKIEKYYNFLIEENNDPVNDPESLKDYMNNWDGVGFIEELQLSNEKEVLEIGVGTGRLALKVNPHVKKFTGIDISKKTIERCMINLLNSDNIELIHSDFLDYKFVEKYDVIYSSLTFLHIKEKLKAIKKVANLLKENGLFVLSIDKNQDSNLNYGNMKIITFPDNLQTIMKFIKTSGLVINKVIEKKFGFIIVSKKLMIQL